MRYKMNPWGWIIVAVVFEMILLTVILTVPEFRTAISAPFQFLWSVIT